MGFVFLVQILPIIVLLVFGFTIGSWVERAHFRRLESRERAIRDILISNLKTLPAKCSSKPCHLVVGEVVIASDYFKTFAAGIRKILGGELRTYETLMERARREALLRMAESAKEMGANAIYNVRLSSSNIGSIRRRRSAAMVEIYAYGTAIHIPDES